jgi:hypothetical protein
MEKEIADFVEKLNQKYKTDISFTFIKNRMKKMCILEWSNSCKYKYLQKPKEKKCICDHCDENTYSLIG